MKKKKWLVFFVLIGILCAVLYRSDPISGDDYEAFLAIGCTASSYSQENDQGYLTILVDTPNGDIHRCLKVDQDSFPEQLSSVDLESLIGVNLSFILPEEFLTEKHLNRSTINAFDFLYNSSIPDSYFTVVGVSVI